jgi:F-type H+-transporting ATPase subunit b
MPGFVTSAVLVIAQATGATGPTGAAAAGATGASGASGATGASGSEGGGNFLVTPNVGLMIWTLVAFAITLLILRRAAFPRIAEALDRRRRAIEDSIDAAEQTRTEADKILQEYRERLREAREQSEDIVARARKAADRLEDEAKADAARTREELMERTRRDIEQETRRAIDQIRREVADLTVMATEKVARKSLDDEDHRRLIQEALDEFDFAALAPGGRGERSRSNGGGESE